MNDERKTRTVFLSFIVHRLSFLPEQPQRGRWTSTGKRLEGRWLSVAVDRPAEGPSARPANRRQRDDAGRSGPQPPLGEDLPEANSAQDQHHVQEREEDHAKLVVQSALSFPLTLPSPPSDGGEGRVRGNEGWFGSPQRFAFLPPSPACRSGRGVLAPGEGLRWKNRGGNGCPLPGSCGPRWNNCAITSRPSGREERS